MEHTLFYKTFTFQTVSLKACRHSDNSAGIACHFLAKMRCGSGVIRSLSGEELHLTAGDIFYLPIGLRYHSFWSVSEDERHTVKWDSFGFVHLPDPTQRRYKMQKIAASPKAEAFLDALKREQTVSASSVGYLYLFFGEVLPCLKEEVEDSRALLWHRAMTHIREGADLTVPALARACGVSESGLYALFREYAHTTPVQMKHKLKAEQAVLLLRYTDRSVEDISVSLGFCSSAYFRKIIKAHTGKTPTTLRREKTVIL